MITIYSVTLTDVGVSYKMILTKHTDKFSNEVDHTNVVIDLYSYNHTYHTQTDGYHPYEIQHFLGSGGKESYIPSSQKNDTNVFQIYSVQDFQLYFLPSAYDSLSS